MATEITIQETITEVSVTDPNNILVEVDGTQGPVGPSNTLSIGTTTVLTPNQNPTSTITGASPSQTLSLGLPRAAAVTVSGTTVVNPNVNPSVATVDTSGDKAITFSLPRAATTSIGTVTTNTADSSASVTNVGTNGDVTLNFTIPRGDTGGIKIEFDTDTADTNPGTGKFKYNNSTIGSVTYIYINNSDYYSNSITGWLASLDDSVTNTRGFLQFTTLTGNVNVFKVVSTVTASTNYYKIPVEYVTGTLPSDGILLSAVFAPSGQDGDLSIAVGDARYVQLTGSTMTGKLTLDGNPSSALHAAPKQYVDNLAAGINFHAAVHLTTTANLTSTYSNGTAGVGATLTATVNDTLTIDGFVAALNERILVKDQTSALQNGIYVVSDAGSGSTPWVLTRATDADNSPAGELATGDFCFTETGTANGGSGFIVTTTGTITIGTTAINYTQFNTAQAITAGTGLTEPPANTLSVTIPVASVSGNTGKYLTTDGTATSWAYTPVTLTGSETLTNKTLTSPVINTAAFKDGTVRGLEEDINIVASAATGTINLEIDTASIWYYTTNATANHTLNIRYSSSVSLNTALPVGDAITVVWMNTNGATAYRPTVIQIDGTTVTPLWQGGSAPTAGNASSTDIYSFTVIKTAATPTYTVLGSQAQFKA